MILTVDVGNTTVRLCGIDKTAGEYTVSFSVKMDTELRKSADAYLADFKRLLTREGVELGQIEGAVLCSVVPKLIDALYSCLRTLIGREVVVVTFKSDTGLKIDLPAPERVGTDRLADAAWAAARYPLPVVTVDMGTATTFNVVDENGVFLGGVIAPGLDTGARALADCAAQLPKIDLSTPDHVIGKNTVECMLSGAVVGAAAMIDGITARIEQELGKPVTLVLTGGLARFVEPLCSHPHSYDPDLLPKGMALLYEKNHGDAS